jgi:putative NADPH-quinone reductase/1,4-dihydroxy-2-naphthoate octaprenyltransferase
VVQDNVLPRLAAARNQSHPAGLDRRAEAREAADVDMSLELVGPAALEEAESTPNPQEQEAGQGARKVLIIVGHPRRQSLCQALASAYASGARRAGAQVRELRLAELRFDPNVRSFDPSVQPVEKALLQARRLITWADHIVFVYPTWWGTMPALLKGFLDRVLAPGFAFTEADRGFAPLLRGRSAELLTTMDTPRWVYRWIYGAPGHKAMARAILGFCGIEIARLASFGPVKDSNLAQRQSWLEQAQRRGQELRRGVFPIPRSAVRKAASWLQALRLQFYPMTWLAYLVGALAAVQPGGTFAAAPFWLGLACLFLIEVAAVLTNEIFDLATDRHNRNFGPFTGGSRVLVDGKLGAREVRCGVAAALGLAAAGAGGLLLAGTGASALLALAVLTALALGYTAPPLKLSYRGLGELDVGLTHSLGAMLCGFAIQGGPWSAPAPWLMSVPVCLAVLPGITLAGVPDHDADRLAGKRTLAVRTGVRGAYLIAANCTALAAAAAIALAHLPALAHAWAGIEYGVLPHAAILLLMLACHAQEDAGARRIDGLMTVALSYVLWFVAVPLVNLI